MTNHQERLATERRERGVMSDLYPSRVVDTYGQVWVRHVVTSYHCEHGSARSEPVTLEWIEQTRGPLRVIGKFDGGRESSGGDPVSYPHLSTDCHEHHGVVRDFGGPRPKIVTLCGSTRFKDTINRANAALTMTGHLVISLGVFGHVDLPDRDWTTGGSDDKRRLDDLHKRKIDLADTVLVVNPGGYIGESTRGEIEYAESIGRPVSYLVPLERAAGACRMSTTVNPHATDAGCAAFRENVADASMCLCGMSAHDHYLIQEAPDE